MNKKDNNYGVCHKTSTIDDVKKLHSLHKGKLYGGQLVQIINNDNTDNSYLIKICVVSCKTKGISISSENYKCESENITIIPKLLWQMLIPINQQNRLKIIEDRKLVDYLLNLNIGQNVFVSTKQYNNNNQTDIIECSIKFIKEMPKIGSGIFYGFEVLKNFDETIQQFIGSADQIIYPLHKIEGIKPKQLNLIDDEIPELATNFFESSNNNFNYSTVFDIPVDLSIEKKAKIIENLKNQLKILSNVNANNILPVDSVYENIHPEKINNSNENIKESVDDVEINKSDDESNSSLSHEYINPLNIDDTLEVLSPENTRVKLLNIAKELCEIHSLNNSFPITIDDYNLIILIENELIDLKKRFKFNNNIDTVISYNQQQPIVDNRQKEENLIHTKSNETKIENKSPIKIIDKKSINESKQFKCFSCSLVFIDKIKIIIPNCRHEICKPCFIQIVNGSKFTLKCPYIDENRIQCNTIVQEHLIEMTVSADIFKIYSMNLQKEIIGSLPNCYSCKTVNCNGIWICDNPNINYYECPVCNIFNCISCETIHSTSTCKQYQRQTIYGIDKTASNNMKTKLTSDEKIAHEMIIEGHVSTDAQAETAVALSKQHPDLDIGEIFWAVKQTHSFEKAQQLLQQSCELCMEKYPRNQMFNMINCDHICCINCARAYFTERITEHSIVDCVCPFCNIPELTADIKDEEHVYFSLLETTLKELLDKHIFNILQSKIRDRCLLKDPFFKWCIKCAFGYTIQRDQIAVTCPECEIITCANCRKPWEEQHQGISCEQFASWKQDNNPDVQEQGIIEYLIVNGIQCPKCKVKYALSKGGCMHFTCIHCKHEFCSGCNQPIVKTSTCFNVDLCSKRGLHAHHPRNCLYYLRDKSILELQNLLKHHNIVYDKDDINPTRNCNIPIQRETPMGFVDDVCNQDVGDNQGGLCGIHFIEYLVDLINKSNIDPILIMSLNDCRQELIRSGIDANEENEQNAIDIFKEKIQKEIPLMKITHQNA